MYRRLMDKISSSDIDGYLATSDKNIKWMGYSGGYNIPGMVLVTAKELYIITKSRNFSMIKKQYQQFNVVFGDLESVHKICKEENINVIGIESNLITFDRFNEIKNLMLDIDVRPLPDFIEDLRMIKTNEEIKLIKSATEVSDKGFTEFLNHLKTGISEKQAKDIFRTILFDMGADDLAFDILLTSGERGFLPHSQSTDKVIEEGDLVLIDFGIVLNGYCSDTTRTVVMGNPTEKQVEMYELVLKAQNNALNSIRAGISPQEADAYARDVIKGEITTGCYDYGLGHGIGMNVHEKPFMRPGNKIVLQENMVVTVEPGIYIEGWGGIRIEDVLVIQKDKPGINLTGCTKELTIIG